MAKPDTHRAEDGREWKDYAAKVIDLIWRKAFPSVQTPNIDFPRDYNFWYKCGESLYAALKEEKKRLQDGSFSPEEEIDRRLFLDFNQRIRRLFQQEERVRKMEPQFIEAVIANPILYIAGERDIIMLVAYLFQYAERSYFESGRQFGPKEFDLVASELHTALAPLLSKKGEAVTSLLSEITKEPPEGCLEYPVFYFKPGSLVFDGDTGEIQFPSEFKDLPKGLCPMLLTGLSPEIIKWTVGHMKTMFFSVQ